MTRATSGWCSLLWICVNLSRRDDEYQKGHDDFVENTLLSFHEQLVLEQSLRNREHMIRMLFLWLEKNEDVIKVHEHRLSTGGGIA